MNGYICRVIICTALSMPQPCLHYFKSLINHHMKQRPWHKNILLLLLLLLFQNVKSIITFDTICDCLERTLADQELKYIYR